MNNKTQMTSSIVDPDMDFLNWAWDLEKEWRNSLPRFAGKELLEIFPEAKKVIPKKIREYRERREDVIKLIKQKLTRVRDITKDKFSNWFWRQWVVVNEGEDLLEIDNRIARLQRLASVGKGRTPKSGVTQEMIQQAMDVPIENLVHQPLRQNGKTLVGLCPLHEERTASFYVYPESNGFYCFGCKRGGNVINFIMLSRNMSFPEAVEQLVG